MTTRFGSTINTNLTDGTVDFVARSFSSPNLSASSLVKTNANKQLVSGSISTSDISPLTANLAAGGYNVTGATRVEGSTVSTPSSTYSTGTASQSTTTVTGVGTTFTSGMIPGLIVFSGGTTAIITRQNTATSLTVTPSQTVTSSSYTIYYGGPLMNALGIASSNIYASTIDNLGGSITMGATASAMQFGQSGGTNYNPASVLLQHATQPLMFQPTIGQGIYVVCIAAAPSGNRTYTIPDVGSSTASFVMTSGSQTLTSKTLTSPVVTGLTLDGSLLPSTVGPVLSAYTRTTFAPTLSDSSGHNFTTSTANGYYTRIGSDYFVSVHINWTGKGSAVAGDAVRISLPVTTNASSPDRYVMQIGYTANITFSRQICGIVSTSQNYVSLIDLASGTTPTNILVSAFGTSGELQFAGLVGV